AAAEAEEAAAWYEARRAGLGGEFREEFKLTLETLREELLPARSWPGRLGERGVKRILMKRFPFYVVFIASSTASVVLAVAHHRKRPAYWRHRLPGATGS
ncbi:MAG: hypothetical protein ACRETH_04455, partial [Steroidobacteraceae bacterium]